MTLAESGIDYGDIWMYLIYILHGSGGYTLFFFGFMIFHWDLHALIHPSGGEARLVDSWHGSGGSVLRRPTAASSEQAR